MNNVDPRINAATTKIYRANTWPLRSSIKELTVNSRKLMANNINSIDINKIIIFFLLTTIPRTPKRNRIKAILR